MAKLFKPGMPPADNFNNPLPKPPIQRGPQRGVSSSRFILIPALFLGFIFFTMILKSIADHRAQQTQQQGSTGGGAPQFDPDKGKRAERSLPEGKMGEWAKAVVYIESGQVYGNQFSAAKSGTGFLIDGNRIVSNNHVIEGESAVVVTYYDGAYSLCDIINAESDIDLAVMRPKRVPSGIQPLPVSNEDNARIGRRVIALGFPLGARLGSEITLTDGLISSVRKNESGYTIWYQISAPVNPGNSGGPMIDPETGKVLGVVTAKVKEADNIGFARPSFILLNWLGEKSEGPR